MSDQYQDTPQYIVYFVLGAAVGAYAVYWLGQASTPVVWQQYAGGALIGGFLALFFGDRFWSVVKKILEIFR